MTLGKVPQITVTLSFFVCFFVLTFFKRIWPDDTPNPVHL